MGLLSKALQYKKRIGEKRDARGGDELNRFIEDVYSETGGRGTGEGAEVPGEIPGEPVQGKRTDEGRGGPGVPHRKSREDGESSGSIPEALPDMKVGVPEGGDEGAPRDEGEDAGARKVSGIIPEKEGDRRPAGERITGIGEEERGKTGDTPGPIPGGEILPYDELKFSDFMVLYEIQKEIARASTADELYDAILFSIMGQIGASSSSIMVRSPKNTAQWIIVKSIGVTIENQDLYFTPGAGILQKMFEKMGIVDIDDYKNDPALIDEYYKYISIDAKLLVPLIQGYEVLGTVILGEKIDSAEFTEEDGDFLKFIGEVSAIALNTINTMEMIMKVNENLSRDFGYIRDVDRFKKKIFHNMSLQKIEQDLQAEFDGMGITGYAIYARGGMRRTSPL